MSDEVKLDAAQKHILTLIRRDKKADGWTFVSEQLFAVLSKNIPTRLAVFEKLEDGGRAKLTDEGESVLNAMAWL
jgi:hypothetical protein